MNPFAVDWNSGALNELADVWILAPDRPAVHSAQVEIDRLLGRDPIGNGIHISEGLFFLHVPPLTVAYTVNEDQHTVEVANVWYAP